jgi:hypothetical protein
MIVRTLLILAATVAAAFSVAFVSAIVLAIVDLYLTGHGQESLNGEWLHSVGGIVDLSRADVLLLLSTLLSSVVAFQIFRRTLPAK